MVDLPVVAARRDLKWTMERIRSVRGRPAKPEDCGQVVERSCVVTEGRAIKIVYIQRIEEDLSALAAALAAIDYHDHYRTSGMNVVSRTFGYMPRIAMRQDYCTASVLAEEAPQAHAEVCSTAALCERYYQRYNPALYGRHRELFERARADGRPFADYGLERGVFTSGIINSNNLLPYHFDAGNFESVWSAMLMLKRNIDGGWLAVPQYDMAFPLPDRSLFMFDGQGLLHGVTPFSCAVHGVPMGHAATIDEPHECDEAHRFSVVFYTLKGMWQCRTTAEEELTVQRKMEARARRR